MRVLVTGAAGFIGSHLCERLLASGHKITGVDDFDPYYDRATKERNLRVLTGSDGFHFLELDLRERAAVASLVAQGWDVVVHLAARGGVRRSIVEPQAYVENNYMATLNVLEAMREGGCGRLVFGSTSSVYGSRSTAPFREDDSTDRPLSPYAATKKACEVLCHVYHHLYGLDIYALRFFTVYGPRQRPDMAIYRFVQAISHHQPIERYGDGSTERDYTYVDDIVEATALAVERVKGYEIINVGGSRTTRLGTLIGLIEELLGERAVIVEKELPPGDVPLTSADTTKAARLLNFESQVPIEEGLKRFIHWFREEQIA
jgi:UDP-glucuronate 4-epimerase